MGRQGHAGPRGIVKFFTKRGIVTKPGHMRPTAPRQEPNRSLARSLKSLQDTVKSAGPAAMASYTLIGAIILLGGLGYALDAWRGTGPWGLLAGLFLGLVVGFYELAKSVWHKP